MRKLSDIVGPMVRDRIVQRQCEARKKAAWLAWEALGERPFVAMLNLMESRIMSRADSDPSALRDFAFRLLRWADDLEGRSAAGGARTPTPSLTESRRLHPINGGRK